MKVILIGAALAALAACAWPQPGGNETPSDDPFAPVLGDKTAMTKTVSNDGFTVQLNFKGQLRFADGSAKAWTDEETVPFVKGAEKWLTIVKGVSGADHHTLAIDVHVNNLDDGLGVAGPKLNQVVKVGDNYFPTGGETLISNYTYTDEFVKQLGGPEKAAEEFLANIVHEYGHIFGIGTLWNIDIKEDGKMANPWIGETGKTVREWAFWDDPNKVTYYEQPNGVRAYNEIFGTKFDFVPLLSGGGHLFSIEDDNKPRTLSDGTKIPEVTAELMANGRSFTIITTGMLDDLGYIVDYEAADPYPN